MTQPMTVQGPLAAGMDLPFLRGKAAELARDIVMQIDIASELAKSYGLSPAQWDALRSSVQFRQLVAEAQRALSGADGVMERIRRKAGLALETAIPDMYGMITDSKVANGARIDAFNALKDLAGVKQSGTTAPPPAVFQLNIAFPGGESQNVQLEVRPPLEHDPQEPSA